MNQRYMSMCGTQNDHHYPEQPVTDQRFRDPRRRPALLPDEESGSFNYGNTAQQDTRFSVSQAQHNTYNFTEQNAADSLDVHSLQSAHAAAGHFAPTYTSSSNPGGYHGDYLNSSDSRQQAESLRITIKNNEPPRDNSFAGANMGQQYSDVRSTDSAQAAFAGVGVTASYERDYYQDSGSSGQITNSIHQRGTTLPQQGSSNAAVDDTSGDLSHLLERLAQYSTQYEAQVMPLPVTSSGFDIAGSNAQQLHSSLRHASSRADGGGYALPAPNLPTESNRWRPMAPPAGSRATSYQPEDKCTIQQVRTCSGGTWQGSATNHSAKTGSHDFSDDFQAFEQRREMFRQLEEKYKLHKPRQPEPSPAASSRQQHVTSAGLGLTDLSDEKLKVLLGSVGFNFEMSQRTQVLAELQRQFGAMNSLVPPSTHFEQEFAHHLTALTTQHPTAATGMYAGNAQLRPPSLAGQVVTQQAPATVRVESRPQQRKLAAGQASPGTNFFKKSESSSSKRRSRSRSRSLEHREHRRSAERRRKRSHSRSRTPSGEGKRKEAEVENKKKMQQERQHLLKQISEQEVVQAELLARRAKFGDELGNLKRQHGEMCRKKQREKDGHKDPLLQENAKLQQLLEQQLAQMDNAKAQRERETKLLQYKLQQVELVLGIEKKKEEPKKSQPSSSKVSVGSDEANDDAKTVKKLPADAKEEDCSLYEYFDAGGHWCRACNTTSTTALDMCCHLHTQEHKAVMDRYDRPWMPVSLKDTGAKMRQTSAIFVQAFKGIEFLLPCDAFYCKLCGEFAGDAVCAEEHLKSHIHNMKYKNYVKLHPQYEQRFNMDKAAAVASRQSIGDVVKPRVPATGKPAKEKQSSATRHKSSTLRSRSRSRQRSRSRTPKKQRNSNSVGRRSSEHSRSPARTSDGQVIAASDPAKRVVRTDGRKLEIKIKTKLPEPEPRDSRESPPPSRFRVKPNELEAQRRAAQDKRNKVIASRSSSSGTATLSKFLRISDEKGGSKTLPVYGQRQSKALLDRAKQQSARVAEAVGRQVQGRATDDDRRVLGRPPLPKKTSRSRSRSITPDEPTKSSAVESSSHVMFGPSSLEDAGSSEAKSVVQQNVDIFLEATAAGGSGSVMPLTVNAAAGGQTTQGVDASFELADFVVEPVNDGGGDWQVKDEVDVAECESADAGVALNLCGILHDGDGEATDDSKEL